MAPRRFFSLDTLGLLRGPRSLFSINEVGNVDERQMSGAEVPRTAKRRRDCAVKVLAISVDRARPIKKMVRFAHEDSLALIHETISLVDMSSLEKRSTFYDQGDVKRMEAEAISLAQGGSTALKRSSSLGRNNMASTIKSDSTAEARDPHDDLRGLEHLTNRGKSRRQMNIKVAVFSVLKEQTRQRRRQPRDNGEDQKEEEKQNSQVIANVYRNVCTSSQDQARKRGKSYAAPDQKKRDQAQLPLSPISPSDPNRRRVSKLHSSPATLRQCAEYAASLGDTAEDLPQKSSTPPAKRTVRFPEDDASLTEVRQTISLVHLTAAEKQRAFYCREDVKAMEEDAVRLARALHRHQQKANSHKGSTIILDLCDPHDDMRGLEPLFGPGKTRRHMHTKIALHAVLQEQKKQHEKVEKEPIAVGMQKIANAYQNVCSASQEEALRRGRQAAPSRRELLHHQISASSISTQGTLPDLLTRTPSSSSLVSPQTQPALVRLSSSSSLPANPESIWMSPISPLSPSTSPPPPHEMRARTPSTSPMHQERRTRSSSLSSTSSKKKEKQSKKKGILVSPGSTSPVRSSKKKASKQQQVRSDSSVTSVSSMTSKKRKKKSKLERKQSKEPPEKKHSKKTASSPTRSRKGRERELVRGTSQRSITQKTL